MKSPAANGGWVKSYRRKWEHPVFNGNLQDASVWAWMCDYAAHEAVTIKTKYGPVHLKRGEILISQRKLAKDFGMSHKRVRTLLSRMASGGTLGAPMLTLSRAHKGDRMGTIARIVNYNKYQGSSAQHQLPLDPAKTPPGHSPGHAKGTQGAREQEEEEVKKDSMVDSAFNKFWEAYPSRSPASNPRKPALEKFRAKVKSGTPAEDILRGAEGYAAAVEQRRAREGEAFDPVTAVCQAVTFINQERWEQYAGDSDAELTAEQRAVLARHNGGKRKWSTPNVVELRLGPGPPEEAYEAAMDAYERGRAG